MVDLVEGMNAAGLLSQLDAARGQTDRAFGTPRARRDVSRVRAEETERYEQQREWDRQELSGTREAQAYGLQSLLAAEGLGNESRGVPGIGQALGVGADHG